MSFWKAVRNGVGLGIGFLLAIGTALLAVTVTGTIHTFSSGDVVSASQINENFTSLKTAIETIEEIPPGAVISFYRDACPTGWTAADGSTAWDFGDGTRTVPDLQNRFVRGTGGSVGLGTYYPGTSFYVYNRTNCHAATGCNDDFHKYVNRIQLDFYNTDSGTFSYTTNLVDNGTSSASSSTFRPDNVGLLYCVKTP